MDASHGPMPAVVDAATVAARLTPARLLPALERMFREGCVSPERHRHAISVRGAPDATLLLMPAWQPGAYLGTKLATVFPGNVARGEPAVAATYVLASAATGRTLAVIDGEELTACRTAATSAVAASRLARADAARLLVCGTGRIARALAEWHLAALPGLSDVLVWGRTPAHAATLAGTLAERGLPARPVADLAAAAASADVIACATLASEPLVRRAWLRPGTHLDLVGGFRPTMAEAEPACFAGSRVVVDTRAALVEAGDLLVPLRAGLLDPGAVADLGELCRGERPGRSSREEITVFKSVGCALEDLAAAILVHEAHGAAADGTLTKDS